MEDVSIAHNNERARWIIAVCVVVCITAVLVGFPLLLGVVPAGSQTLDSTALRAAALQCTNSLKTVTVPEPSNFNVFIRPDTCFPQPCGKAALQSLGKAVFWDQQLGSDGQACASCYFHAGADNLSKNQLDPELRNQTPGVVTSAFHNSTGFGPNYQLSLRDSPSHRVSKPDVNPELDPAHSAIVSDTNDIASSQGVFNAVAGMLLQCNVPRILARPEEAALLPEGNPTRTAVEALIAAAESLLAAVPPDPVMAAYELAKNPALPCPTVTNPNGSVAQADGALDLLTRDLSPQHPLLQAASSLLPDARVPGTVSKLLAPLLRPQERVAVDGAHTPL